ncbi:MAG: phospholipid carrier-dependent glycosyltransferase [Candidatus Hydrothermarchaeota archaeon]
MDSIAYIGSAKGLIESGRLQYAHSPGYPGVGIIFGLSNLFLDLPMDRVSIYTCAIIGSLSVPLMYLFAFRFTKNKRIGLITALLLMVNPLHWSLSEQALGDVLSFFFLVFSAYMLTFNNRVRILSALVFGVAIAIRLTNILFFPFYLFLLVRERKINYILAGSILSLTGFFFYIPAYLMHGFEYFLSPVVYNRFFPKLFLSIKDYLLDIFCVSLSTAFIPLTLFGIAIILRDRKYFHLTALALWIFPYFFYFGNIITFSARFFLPIIAPLLLLMAVSLSKIEKKAGMLLVLFIITQSMGYIYPVLDSRATHSYQEEFALFVKNNTEEDSLIIVSEERAFISYYGNRTTIPTNVSLTESYLKEGKPVYLISSAFFTRGGREKEEKFKENFNFTLIGTKLNEDFHHKSIYSGFFDEYLYELKLKNTTKS